MMHFSFSWILLGVSISLSSSFQVPFALQSIIATQQICLSTHHPVKTSSIKLISYRCRAATDSFPLAASNVVPLDKCPKDGDEDTFGGSIVSLNPSYLRLTAFTLTACTSWFAEPIQSLVDTVVVGRQGTSQLAALGPATILFDGVVFLCYFLSVATTTRLGKAIAKGDSQKQQAIISQSIGVAVVLGLFTMGIILGFGHYILRWMAGLSLARDGMSYASIRVVGAPASVVRMVCDSVCLAYLDTATSALTVLAATMTNIIGDFLLCVIGNFGIRGAAAATAFAELVACSILLFKVRQRFIKIRSEDRDKSGTTSYQITPFVQFPDHAELVKLFKLGGPILFVILGELACQFITTLGATSCGVLSLATHNIILRIYLFFATFGDGLSATVQAFLPRFLYENRTSPEEKEKSVKHLLTKLVVIGLGFSVMCGTATCLLTILGAPLFTSNKAIVELIESTTLWLSSIFLLQPFNLLLEGGFTVLRDFPFLVVTYTTSLTFLAIQMRLGAPSVANVWKGFFFFHIVRLIQFIFRTKQQMTRKNNSQMHA